MVLKFRPFLLAGLVLCSQACGEDKDKLSPGTDAGTISKDAAEGVDTGVESDMGTMAMADAGQIDSGVEPDMGTADAGQIDMGSAMDAGPVDSGEPPNMDLAPLTMLSGTCPDFTQSGISTFMSSGMMRKAAVIFPAMRPANMPVVFVFHGLTTPASMPVESFVQQLQLQRQADALGVVFVVPEALAQNITGVGMVSLWSILGDPAVDLTLFDDLRTCAKNNLDVNLRRVAAFGHSGGALWSTVLLVNRSNSLATVVEYSGGSDFTIPILGGPFVAYQAPNVKVPVLLGSGGMTDTWPSQFALIRFEDTSDTLQQNLRRDQHFVVRCKHELGHVNFPPEAFPLAFEWLTSHEFGMPSPYETTGLEDQSWCMRVP